MSAADDRDADTAARHAMPAAPQRGRTISAQAALRIAVATLVLGLGGGVLVARSPSVRRWFDGAPAEARPAVDENVARADAPPGPDEAQEPSAVPGEATLAVVDRTGRTVRGIPAERPWTPRFSPDGRRIVYGAFGSGRNTSDLWVTDLDDGETRRLTDDDADSNDPQWGPGSTTLAYSVRAPGGKDVVSRPLAGGGERAVMSRDGVQFPSDWLRDGSALLVTDQDGSNGNDVLVQPADGAPARPYVATPANETAARVSPDGHWVAYTSDASGQQEVYLDSYPRAGRRVRISSGGGMHPVWRGNGRELYYWRDGALMAVPLGASRRGSPPAAGAETVLFRAAYPGGVSTMYDVSPDGQRFVIVR